MSKLFLSVVPWDLRVAVRWEVTAGQSFIHADDMVQFL